MARKRFSLSLSLVSILPLRGRFNKAALQRDGQAERLTSWTLASLDRPPSLPFALSLSLYASNYGGNVDLETDFVSSNPFLLLCYSSSPSYSATCINWLQGSERV